MAFTGTDQPQTFTLCLTTVSASSCEASSAPPDIQLTQPIRPRQHLTHPIHRLVVLHPSMLTARTSANMLTHTSPVAIGLPNGEVASVTGKSPAGNFFKVSYKNINGWVAAVAVGSSGDCSGVPVVNPPAFVPTPTPTPIPPDSST